MTDQQRGQISSGNDSPEDITFEDVFEAELPDIQYRRTVARKDETGKQEEETPTTDLVGLALSGGGVRSGAMSLGAFQLLHKLNVLKSIDYLSTVSGGSYAGAYLTSQALKDTSKTIADEDCLDVAESKFGKQPKRVLDFIFNGSYLRDTVGFLNNQLFGMTLILIVVGSGLVAVSSLIAVLFRCLDTKSVRFWADGLGARGDILLAFLPSICLFLIWILVWIGSIWRRSTRQTGAVARFTFYLLAFSVVVAFAALLGTGEISLGPSPAAVKAGRAATSAFQASWALALGALTAALLPYLSPKRLIKSGTRPSNAFEKYWYWLATRALAFGLPFVFVSLMVQENISHFNNQRDSSVIERTEIQGWKRGITWAPLWEKFREQGVLKKLEEKKLTLPGRTRQTVLNSVNQAIGTDESNIPKYVILPRGVREHQRNRLDIVGDDSQPTFDSFDSLFAKLELIHETREEIKDEYLSWGRGWLRPLGTAFKANRDLLDSSEGIKKAVTVALGDAMKSPEFLEVCFPLKQPDEKESQAVKVAIEAGFASGVASGIASIIALDSISDANYKTAVEKLPPGKERSLRLEALTIAEILKQGSQVDGKELAFEDLSDDLTRVHRGFLQFFSNEGISPKSRVYSYVCLEHDQSTRLRIFAISGAIFLLMSSLVDLNAVSCHRFYKTKLREMWIEDVPGGIPVHKIDTTNVGFPYHLISASLAFQGKFDRNKGYEKKDHFLFSKRYCGSERIGFRKSTKYLDGSLQLDDAVALSGAAISVVHIRNPLIVMLLFLSNMWLGQWLENPSGRSLLGDRLNRLAKRLPVTPFRILCNWFRPAESRPFIFVADGGHFENLAINELLKRRCRLIIALDAGADPDYKFEDMLRLVRWARMRHGIRLSPLGSKTDAEDVSRLCPADSWLSPRSVANSDGNASSSQPGLSKRWSQDHFVVWKISYSEEDQTGREIRFRNEVQESPKDGILIFMKSSMSGDEPFELIKYQADNDEFPHDSTTDQFFDPPKFEAYRQLGLHIADSAIRGLPEIASAHPELNENPAFARLMRSLRSPADDCEESADKKNTGDPDIHDSEFSANELEKESLVGVKVEEATREKQAGPKSTGKGFSKKKKPK